MVSVAHRPVRVTGHQPVSDGGASVQRQPESARYQTSNASHLTPSERARRAAVWAAEQGFYVFPLAPDSKRPAVRDWEARATHRPDYIAERWPNRATGYGIACGPSGLYVVDCDTPKSDSAPPPDHVADAACGLDVLCLLAAAAGEPMPAGTLTVRTGRGGYHLDYLMPRGLELRNTAYDPRYPDRSLGWCIDTRGGGGYVVGPGSQVDGRTYEVVDWSAPAELPGWLLRRLTEIRERGAAGHAGAASLPASPVRLSGSPVGPEWAARALEGEAERIRSAPAGAGNHAVNAAAFAVGRLVGGRVLDRAAAETALTAALDTWSWSAPGDRARMLRTLRGALSAGEQRPRVPEPREQRRTAR